jgi:hypothetical protein
VGPFPPSGRNAQFDFGAVFRIAGGKIAVVGDLGQHDDSSGHLAIFRVAEMIGNLIPVDDGGVL